MEDFDSHLVTSLSFAKYVSIYNLLLLLLYYDGEVEPIILAAVLHYEGKILTFLVFVPIDYLDPLLLDSIHYLHTRSLTSLWMATVTFTSVPPFSIPALGLIWNLLVEVTLK